MSLKKCHLNATTNWIWKKRRWSWNLRSPFARAPALAALGVAAEVSGTAEKEHSRCRCGRRLGRVNGGPAACPTWRQVTVYQARKEVGGRSGATVHSAPAASRRKAPSSSLLSHKMAGACAGVWPGHDQQNAPDLYEREGLDVQLTLHRHPCLRPSSTTSQSR
jgi:hypothetical protein